MGTGIHEVVERMNKLRKQANMMGYGVLLICFVPLPFIFIIPILMSLGGEGQGSFGVSVSLLFIIYMVVVVVGTKLMGGSQKKMLEEFKRLYKETFLSNVFEEFFDNVDYRWNIGMSRQKFMEAEFYSEYKLSEFHSEDLLRGTYKGIHFEQSDAVLRTKRDDTTITLFSGRMIMIDYPLKSVQSVKLIPKVNKELDVDIQLFPDVSRAGTIHHPVVMENVEFNSTYMVDAVDSHDAFYILTPQVMEQIVAIWNKYRKSSMNDGSRANVEGIPRLIAFHFKQDKLYVVIDHMDSFDTNMLKEVDYSTEKEKIRQHIQVIIDIIEMLKLINA